MQTRYLAPLAAAVVATGCATGYQSQMHSSNPALNGRPATAQEVANALEPQLLDLIRAPPLSYHDQTSKIALELLACVDIVQTHGPHPIAETGPDLDGEAAASLCEAGQALVDYNKAVAAVTEVCKNPLSRNEYDEQCASTLMQRASKKMRLKNNMHIVRHTACWPRTPGNR